MIDHAPNPRPSAATEPAVRHSYQPLSPDDLARIDAACLEVFEDVGFEVHEPEAFELFRKAGASCDADRRLVRLTEPIVRELVSRAPSQITLHGRDPGHDLQLGAGNVYAGTGGTALNVLDYDSQQRRPAQLGDLIDVIRIVDALEHVHFMLLPTYPNELSVERVDINRFFAGLMHTTKHVMGGVYTADGIDEVIAAAEQVAGSAKALREKPFISMIACGISPLLLDAKYGAFMIKVAKAGIPLAVPTEPLCGATAPITLAGTLVIQHCDALINVMLTQMVNPGTPVLYGCVATATDLRDLSYLGGPVESGLINAGVAQLAQRWGLPYYATAGISDSKTLDAQCGYEAAVSNLLVCLAGADFIHDAAGLMEFAMTVSKEKLVLDDEILGACMRAVRGIGVSDATLAVDAIRKAGPGGNFVAARHTRKHMRKEHFMPRLSDRDKREAWEAGGRKTAAERAHERVQTILSAPAEPCIALEQAQALVKRFDAIDAEAYAKMLSP